MCIILHEVTPVIEGERFVFKTQLYMQNPHFDYYNPDNIVAPLSS